MQALLRTARQRRPEGERGFTMIELLVVVVIIGVLVGIAIPVYLNYRKGAENKSAQSDVRGAITVIEQYYTDNGNTYPDDQAGAVNAALVWGTAKVSVSQNNALHYNKTASGYVVCGQNTNGETVFLYNSEAGGVVKKSSKGTLAECASTGT